MTIHAIKHDNTVHAIVGTDMYQRKFDDTAKAVNFYNLVLSTKENPTSSNVEVLLNECMPGRKLLADNIFTLKGGNFYLAGYESVAMPEELVVRIQSHIEQDISVLPLVNFWKLLLLNPDAAVRDSLFKFMSQYDFPITDNGYFIGYRAVKKTNKTYSAVTNWVPKEFVQLKAAGENPDDYTVVENYDGEGDIKAVETDVITDEHGNFLCPENVVGNLGEMFTNQNTGITDAPEFTDWYSGKTNVRLGGTVSMPRESVDCNPQNTCSAGLHIGAPEYVKGFGGSGSEFLACLVNPMNVCAIPADYSYQKMRVSEYYAYGMVDLNNDMEIRTPYFELDYKTFEERQLDEQLKEYQATIDATEQAVTARAIIAERRMAIA
jgi:hypothetical protein